MIQKPTKWGFCQWRQGLLRMLGEGDWCSCYLDEVLSEVRGGLVDRCKDWELEETGGPETSE